MEAPNQSGGSATAGAAPFMAAEDLFAALPPAADVPAATATTTEASGKKAAKEKKARPEATTATPPVPAVPTAAEKMDAAATKKYGVATVPGVPIVLTSEATKDAIVKSRPVDEQLRDLLVTPEVAPGRHTLFSLAAEFHTLIARLDAVSEIEDKAKREGAWEALDREVISIAQKLDKLDPEIDKKIEGWGKFIQSINADEKAAKTEADRLAARASTFKKLSDATKAALCNVMDALGKQKVKTALLTVYTQANPVSIEVESAEYVPTKFIKPPAPPEERVDKKALLEWIQAGNPAPKGVKVLDERRHLRIA